MDIVEINTIDQKVEFVKDIRRKEHLKKVLIQSNNTWAIVFVETKKSGDELITCLFNNGFSPKLMHKNRMERELGLKSLDTEAILVATKGAAQGVIAPHVINFDLPKHIDHYILRITLAGNSGYATSFFKDDDIDLANPLIDFLAKTNQLIPYLLTLYAKKSLAAHSSNPPYPQIHQPVKDLSIHDHEDDSYYANAVANNFSDILYSPITIDISLPVSTMKSRSIDLCKNLFKRWSNLDDSCFHVDFMETGFQLLVKATLENGIEEQVSVLLYAPDTDCVIKDERRLLVFKHLSAAGFCQKLLAIFGNGMVQSIINARFIKLSDLREPKWSGEIAKLLKKFHAVNIPGFREPRLWVDISTFLDEVVERKFNDIDQPKKYEAIPFEEIRSEISDLKALTQRLQSPVVFCHNELSPSRLMLNKEEGKAYVVDHFEFASYNYRGYDIGNHFNAYGGFYCDYNRYPIPTKDQQFHFFRHYLRQDAPHEVPMCELEALYMETNTFMLASHLYWGLWVLVKADLAGLDTVKYFNMRYAEYKRQKEVVFSLSLLPQGL